MNIYILNSDPDQCAVEHIDLDVQYQIPKLTYLLCTVLREAKWVTPKMTLPTNMLPSVPLETEAELWALESPGNAHWVMQHLNKLLEEYNTRWPSNKPNVSQPIIEGLDNFFKHSGSLFFVGQPTTPFPKQYPSKFSQTDPVKGYQDHYEESHADFAPNWTNRSKPSWHKEKARK